MIVLILAASTIAVYWQCQYYPYLTFDDRNYLESANVGSGLTLHNIGWTFTHVHFSNWHPLTSLAYTALVQCFGRNARLLHWLNLILHIGNVLLLFAALCWMTQATWRSAFVAALFALHPLHVESVAWIAELKDVLSGFFFLLVLIAYTHYARRLTGRSYAVVVFLLRLPS